MGYIFFTIPYISELKSENGWKRDPKSNHTYSIIRLHYAIRERQLEEPVKKGEIIDALSSISGITQRRTDTFEYEFNEEELTESIEESLQEVELTNQLVSTIKASVGVNKFAKIFSELKSDLKHHLKDSFKDSFKLQTTRTYHQKRQRVYEWIIDPNKFDSNTTIVAVKAYKRFSIDVYCAFLDHLIVKYERSSLGIPFKRKKIPPVEEEKHINIIKLDLPLVSIVFWKPIQTALLLVNENDYKNEVSDPCEVVIEDLRIYKKIPVKLPPEPSLYDLSESTFPRKKWI